MLSSLKNRRKGNPFFFTASRSPPTFFIFKAQKTIGSLRNAKNPPSKRCPAACFLLFPLVPFASYLVLTVRESIIYNFLSFQNGCLSLKNVARRFEKLWAMKKFFMGNVLLFYGQCFRLL